MHKHTVFVDERRIEVAHQFATAEDHHRSAAFLLELLQLCFGITGDHCDGAPLAPDRRKFLLGSEENDLR